MRTAFISQLIEEAKTDDKIFLVVGDLGFSVIEGFEKMFPDRFLNAGIAEQNMMGVAAGLAKEGYNVYVYSIGNFPTLRCMEQIRYDVAYHNLNVKIVSVGAGYAYGPLGASHHATEDLGMMRTIPNMVVCTPGDPVETKAITKLSALHNGPMYLRLGKAGEKIVHKVNLLDLKIGDFINIIGSDNSRIALLASGSILSYAYEFILHENIDVDLFSVPFVCPINNTFLVDIANKYSNILVIEENQRKCGVGSAVIERINDLYVDNKITQYPRIKRICINDEFTSISGNQEYLREQAKLTLQPLQFMS